MQKHISEIKSSFQQIFEQRLKERGLDYVGCEPVETNENGAIMNRSKLPKGYTKEYISVMKELE